MKKIIIVFALILSLFIVSGCNENNEQTNNNEKNSTQNENSKKINLISWFIPISIFCFIIAGIFFYKGYDAKNNYHNSEYYTSLNKNAYVGGDAYNYIINGTYFTGYSVIASAFLLSGVMFNINGIKLYNANTEKEKNNVSN